MSNVTRRHSSSASVGLHSSMRTCKDMRRIHSMSLIVEEPLPIHAFFSPIKEKEVLEWPLSLDIPKHGRAQGRLAMSTANEMDVKKWDGAVRMSLEWDGLRRDPDLWYPEGNCVVYLYGRGQSRRGPSFRIPLNALLAAECQPLIDKFMVKEELDTPTLDTGGKSEADYFFNEYTREVRLYMPAPAMAERGEAFLYHTATRNLFAWICQKALVGPDLGTALVALLNSMVEFRSKHASNVDDIVSYIERQGYADMRNTPDHALAIMYFAEHFHFKDMWIDAFAHCTGMNEKLHESPGFGTLNRQDRAFISRSRLEMDLRLDKCGRMMGKFLFHELSEANLKLTSGGRAHLNNFRSFLISYYTAKLGSYPPAESGSGSAAFPKSVFMQMRSEMQKLYDFLVDTDFCTEPTPSFRWEVRVLKSINEFDARHKMKSLAHPLPLLPQDELRTCPPTKQPRSKRISLPVLGAKIIPLGKMQLDPRLATIDALNKATNRQDPKLAECTLVRAYKGFEKECVFPAVNQTSVDKISHTEGRKIRWILIYTTLQVLIDATTVPEQVLDTYNVPYNICVRTGGCPPWNDRRSCYDLVRTQSAQALESYRNSLVRSIDSNAGGTPLGLQGGMEDYFSRKACEQERDSTISTSLSIQKIAAKVKHSSGTMPELQHPRPQRRGHLEIIGSDYQNGIEKTLPEAGTSTIKKQDTLPRKPLPDSPASSRWSDSSFDRTNLESSDPDSPRTHSRRSSCSSAYSDTQEQPLGLGVNKSVLPRPYSAYSVSIYDEDIEEEDETPVQDLSELVATSLAPSPLFSAMSSLMVQSMPCENDSSH